VGMALTAAVGLGLYPDFDALKNIVRVENEYEPQECNAGCYDSLYRTYRRLYCCLRQLYRDVNEPRFCNCDEQVKPAHDGK
jgi:sugar (pentulose or hexulose) kinase